MSDKGSIKLHAVVIDCTDPHALATFYAKLLDWEILYSDEQYVDIGVAGTRPGMYPCIIFQRNSDYQPPVWPENPGEQQQMEHLDFVVEDMEEAVERAIRCGATLAKDQFSDVLRVLFDPAGHPFCLCKREVFIKNDDFKLL